MSYCTVSQVRNYGLVKDRISNETRFPDAVVQSAIDKTDSIIDGHIALKFDLPLSTSGSFIEGASIIGASFNLLRLDGVATEDTGTGLLIDAYMEYFGPSGLLIKTARGQFIPPGLVDSTPSIHEGRSKMIAGQGPLPTVRTYSTDGTEYF